jgi:hypothetical protein
MPRRAPRFTSHTFADLVQAAGNRILDGLERGQIASPHHPSSGRERESGLREFLAEALPAAYSIGEGFAFDARDSRSRQLDVLVARNPPFVRLMTGDQHWVVPCECLLAAVEVKHVLTKHEVTSAVQNAASLRSLRPYGDWRFVGARQGGSEAGGREARCLYSLIAVDTDLSPGSDWARRELARFYETCSESDTPTDIVDRLVILSRGTINLPRKLARPGSADKRSNAYEWFVHLSNHLEREAARRPPLDIDVYAGTFGWEEFT